MYLCGKHALTVDSLFYPVILFAIGIVVGAINTVAGGGSLITLPLLIFMGLDPVTANGTNRLSILTQSIFGIAGFKSKGVSNMRYGIWLGISAMLGAIPGAIFAVEIDDGVFKTVLAIIMLVVMITLIYNPFKGKEPEPERMSRGRLIASIIIFFFIGAYVGFIQAGAGFLIIATLTVVNRFDLLRTNNIKLWVVLWCTILALSIFMFNGRIDWPYAIALAGGSALGSWVTSRFAATKGDKWIRPVLVLMILVMSLKLLGVLDWLQETVTRLINN